MSRSRDTGDILNRISGGVSGGQSYIGGTGSGENLTLASTSNATKGFIYLGAAQTSGFDGVNSRLGIGVAAPTTAIHALSTTEQLRLGYDASNFASFTVSSTGVLTITPTVASNSIALPNGFSTNATFSNANLSVFTGNSAINTTTASYQFGGSSAQNFRVGMKGSTSTVLAVGNNYSNLFVGGSGINRNASGTHGILANCVIKAIGTVGGSGAAITNTASLYIEAAITDGTNNYSLWVDAGKVRFDEVLNLQTYTNSSPVDGDLWYDGTNLKFRQSSTTKTVTWT